MKTIPDAGNKSGGRGVERHNGSLHFCPRMFPILKSRELELPFRKRCCAEFCHIRKRGSMPM